MRDQISDAAKMLDDLLMYTPDKGQCPVGHEEAQRMWDAVNELSGFCAVRAFLDVCKTLTKKEPPRDTFIDPNKPQRSRIHWPL